MKYEAAIDGTGPTSDIDRRLSGVEQRLLVVERALRLAGPVTPMPVTAALTARTYQPTSLTSVSRRRAMESLLERNEGSESLTPAPVIPPPQPNPAAVSRKAVALRYMEPPPAATPAAVAHAATKVNLEQLIGLKWTGWVGAIVLVIGAALGFKFAYDQGWLGLLPAGPKVGLLALCGIGLIAAGEYVFRKINQLSAVGLYGAGVAVLFLSGYAGHAWYGLFAQSTAMALMGASALAGILIAGRADLVSIAVLAMIGGNLAPLLLGGRTTALAPFLTYLLFLQAMALALCAWQARPKWWVLRGVSLVTTSLWLAYIAMRTAIDPSLSATTLTLFAILSAIAYQAELLVTRRRAWRDQTLSIAGRSEGVVFSVLATAVLAGVLLLLLRGQHVMPGVRGGSLMGIAAGVAMLGWTLRFTRVASWADLSLGFRVQAMLLLMLALPVTFDGPTRIFGWLTLALGLAIVGSVSRSRASLVGGGVTWALAILAWALWPAFDAAAAKHVWLTIGTLSLNGQFMTGVAIALGGHVIAVLSEAFDDKARTGDDMPRGVASAPVTLPLAVNLLAVLLMVVVALRGQPSPAAGTLMLVVYAWALFGASYLRWFAGVTPLAMGVLALAAAKWITFDVLLQRLNPTWDAMAVRPLLNAQFGLGLLLSASTAMMGWLNRPARDADRDVADDESASDRAARDHWALTLVGVFAGVLTFAASIELDRGLIQAQAAGMLTGWPEWTARGLLLAMLWMPSLVAATWFARSLCRTPAARTTIGRGALTLGALLAAGYVVTVLATAVLPGQTLVAPVLVNLQTFAGVVVTAGLVALAAIDRRRESRALVILAVPLLLLVAGSAEIDRWARQQLGGPVWIVRQVGWSIWWSMLAVGSLVAGFGWRLTSLRIAALGLLAITLLKVVLVDLAGIGTGWRILSFLAVGALLLGTSVLYGRFDRVLRGEPST